MLESLIDELEERKEKLKDITDDSKRSLKNLPKGKLTVESRNNRPQYYRSNDHQSRGKYIRTSDIETARKLAQADYLRRVIKSTEEEIRKINSLIKFYTRGSAEDVAGSLHPARRELITPIWKSDEEYAEDWQSEEYEKMGFSPGAPEYYTTDKERMRSKSEVIIAEHLKKYGIPYMYEYPLWINDFKMVRPDFRVLNVRKRRAYFWEHLGMMSDPEYAMTNIKKIDEYILSGLIPGRDLILTFETKECPLNVRSLDMIIEEYLI